MDPIMELSRQHGFHVIEDAAQAIDSYYKEILIAKPPYTVIVISAYDKYGKSKEKILEISKN
jgi:dTDP-4-amino-4,6-dideoxygalactose transaminase